MKGPRKKEKYYLVLSKRKKYKYGAFPYSEDGLKLAKSYVKKHADSEDLYIIEK